MNYELFYVLNKSTQLSMFIHIRMFFMQIFLEAPIHKVANPICIVLVISERENSEMSKIM